MTLGLFLSTPAMAAFTQQEANEVLAAAKATKAKFETDTLGVVYLPMLSYVHEMT